MSNYNKAQKLYNDLYDIAKMHNMVIITATQPKRDDIPMIDSPLRTSTAIIDHISFIKLTRGHGDAKIK